MGHIGMIDEPAKPLLDPWTRTMEAAYEEVEIADIAMPSFCFMETSVEVAMEDYLKLLPTK